MTQPDTSIVKDRALCIHEMRSRFGFSMFEAGSALDAYSLFQAINALSADESLKRILWALAPKMRHEVKDFIDDYIAEQDND